MNSSNSDAFTSVAGGTFMTVLAIAGVVLAILAVLMPATVYFIYCEARRLRKIAEKNLWNVEQIRAEVIKIRARWDV